jgi:predicted nucleic acid-binding protein
MRKAFADTAYWVATIDPRDQHHQAAHDARITLGQSILVTTDEVLGELLTVFSKSGELMRQNAVKTVKTILANPNVEVIAQTRDGFLRALERYSSRKDKEYSYVDCSSMAAMEREGLTDVLTSDHHFTQEGFNVLIHSVGASGNQ